MRVRVARQKLRFGIILFFDHGLIIVNLHYDYLWVGGEYVYSMMNKDISSRSETLETTLLTETVAITVCSVAFFILFLSQGYAW